MSAPPRRGPASRARGAWLSVSFALHAVVIGLFWLMPPRPSALCLDALARIDRVVSIEDEAPIVLAGTEPSMHRRPGRRHAEQEGAMGAREPRPRPGRFAVARGPRDRRPSLARESIASIGVIGALNAMPWAAPSSPYGAAAAHGEDPTSALGALMGEGLADAQGAGGLGMIGTGRGGGGSGLGTIGVSRFGTIGGSGYGRGAGGLAGRTSRDPLLHCGGGPSGGCASEVQGSLSRDVIRRVVRRHHGEVRFCYEQGLTANPSLEGRVAVQWIIAPDGRVASASLASSDLASASVEHCIVRAVSRWTFPANESGPTGVSYPFVLHAS